ncbi:HAD family phosphatase [Irregularibacter muris]|uniref:HAD family phosphatase n=1 Tax=Irregularibacter muris TaxID=1796619 RepID=A0AAE3KZ88_9FIRM|nr:HAD family phosphatase [Irregularibacter muris]MCR1898321.1 HAD family phosphatase [Irregularibacter muris]
MIDTIIFDIGRVLLEYQPERYLKTKYSPSMEIAETLFENIFASAEWIELDRGTMEVTRAKEVIGKRIPHYQKQVEEVLDTWHELMVPIMGTVDIMNKLREKKYNIYLLSNMNDKIFDIVHKKYKFLREVDGEVISAHVKLLKPQREIYQEIIQKYNLTPSQCIFIDDMKPNAQGAEKVGIRGIHFISPQQLEAELKELGVL